MLTLVVLDLREKLYPGMVLIERGCLELVLGLSRPSAGKQPVVVMHILILMLLVYRKLFLSTVVNCHLSSVSPHQLLSLTVTPQSN